MFKLSLIISLILSFSFYLSGQSPLAIGEKCPPVQITDWVQNIPSDKDLKNKVLVIDFWATWCGPCIKAVPHFNELTSKFANENRVLFLSMTYERVTKIKRTLERIKFKSAVVTDQENKTQEAFGIAEIPYTVVIKEDGTLAWKGHSESLTTAIIQAILAGEAVALPETTEKKETVDLNEKNLGMGTLGAMMRDSTVTRGFKMIPVKKVGSFTVDGLPKLYYQSGASLEVIISGFLQIPETRIQVPEAFKNDYFNIVYVDKEQNSREKALEYILSNIKLDYGADIRQEMRTVEVYTVQVRKPKLLTPSNAEQAGQSDAGDKIVFTGQTIGNVLLELENYLKIPLIDRTELSDSFDFIIEVNHEKALLKSLKSYGLKLTKSTEEVKFCEVLN